MRIGTTSSERLGTSIPTRARPGIGASTRIWPPGAARAIAMSLLKETILASLVPRATSKAYWVTDGPLLTSTTRAVIPKESRVFSIIWAFLLTSPRSALAPSLSSKISILGYCQTLFSVEAEERLAVKTGLTPTVSGIFLSMGKGG